MCARGHFSWLACVTTGFARLDNVEFYRSGQEGFTEPYDPRYSLAYVDVYNNPSLGFQSYVRDCSFHNGFSPAIGVFGVPDLEVIGNVIHHVVGMGKQKSMPLFEMYASSSCTCH